MELKDVAKGVKGVANKVFSRKAAGVALAFCMAASLVWLWLIWQGPDALPDLSAGTRAWTTVAAVLALVVGSTIVLLVTAGKARQRFAWMLAAVGVLAALTMWYCNSVLKVSPSSARIPRGSLLPLTAGPTTLLEHIRGRGLVEWSSSDESVAILLPRQAPANGQVAMVRGIHSGRATIFAVRGRVRSESRLSVDSSGVIFPVCAVDSTRVKASSATGTADTGRTKTADSVQSRGPASTAGRETCIEGSISSPGGQPVRRAKVSLKALGDTGDTIWVQYGLTDPVDGRYQFRIPGDTIRPVRTFLLSVHQQLGETNPVWFVPTQWGLDTASRVLDADLLRAGAFENGVDIKLQYSSQSAFALVLLLFPGIFGLSSTVLYYAAKRPNTETPREGGKDREPFFVRNYVFSNVVVWGLLVAVFAMLYAFRGVQSIPLLGDRIAVPTVAPTFAYLGVLVYVIYVLAADYVRALGTPTPTHSADRQLLLLSLVNRIVIAPYVAIVAVVALFSKLDQPMVPFVAFFTGLWIEPVLGTLKEIGDRLVRQSDQPGTPKPTRLDPLDQARALLQQQQSALVKDQPVEKVEVESTTTPEGKVTPTVVIYVRAPGETPEARAKRFPPSLEGDLPDGTHVSFPIVVRQFP